MTDEAAGDVVLSLEGVTRRFGSVVALDRASLRVRRGTVHAVLGENGAGKTTLMRVAFGLLQPDDGTIRLQGVTRTIASPAVALSLGVGMVHQHFTLVPAMTVSENVALGGRGLFDPRAAAARVRDVATRAGLSLDPDAIVGTLPVGAQQRCEIVKALARDVSLLILDEPTAVLAPAESTELLQWIRAHADAGNAVVLITHKLRDAIAIADDVTVLRRGRTVYTRRASDTDEAGLADAMLGSEETGIDRKPVDHRSRSSLGTMSGNASGSASRSGGGVAINDDIDALLRTLLTERGSAAASSGSGAPIVAASSGSGAPIVARERATVLNAERIHVRDVRGVERVRGASMYVRAGEIVGIAAVEGEGQHELLRVLAGRAEPVSGTLTRPTTVGFVPEDRHREALLLDATLLENIALRDAGARRGRMPWSALRAATVEIVRDYKVRNGSTGLLARALSGGNQQKLVLGRELREAPTALVVENPSRGLDFRATAAVRDALRAARDGGAAVVLYSSDLDELLLLADRVYAMHNGVLTETARDRDLVGRAMLSA